MDLDKERCPWCGNRRLGIISIPCEVPKYSCKVVCSACGISGPHTTTHEDAMSKFDDFILNR